MKSFEGYLKLKLGNSYVLLAEGGHRHINDFILPLNTSPAATISTGKGVWQPVTGRYVFQQNWTDSSTGSDTADFGIFLDGNLTANMVLDGYYYTLAGYKVGGKNDSSVLLAGGGTKALSDFKIGDYLPLTGGTLTTSSNTNILDLNGSAGSEVGIRFLRSGIVKGWVGYIDGGYMYIYNAQRNNYLKYNDNGTLTFEGNIVYHSGNLPARLQTYSLNTSDYRNADTTCLENGFYWVNAGTLPPNVGDADIITVNANSSYGHQLAFKFSGVGTTGSSYDGKDLYTRIYSNGSWLPWYTIVTSGNWDKVIPYPAGFTSRGTSDWSGVTGTLATDWSVNGADIMFKYNDSMLNVITDGRFYQGIDIYGASKRVLDEYDISNTKWGDADTVDGLHATYFVNDGTTWSKSTKHDGFILNFTADVSSTNNNPFSLIGGNAATVIQVLPNSINWGALLAFGFSNSRVVWRSRMNSSSMSDWIGIIAGSADKLETSRKIWGQLFDGSANISGNMTGVGDITFTDEARIHLPDVASNILYIGNASNKGWVMLADTCSQRGSNYWRIISSGLANFKQVGINMGTTNPSYPLHVSGNVGASNFYTTSDIAKKKNISSFSEHIRKFQLKDTEKWHYGVIAQEVPEMFRDGEEGSMTVNYNSILSYYIGILENKINLLEQKIKYLENK